MSSSIPMSTEWGAQTTQIQQAIATGAEGLAASLSPIGDSLLEWGLAFAIVWMGIKIALDRSPEGMEGIIADLLKLILAWGFGKAIISEYSTWSSALLESVAAILKAIGIDETNIIGVISYQYLGPAGDIWQAALQADFSISAIHHWIAMFFASAVFAIIGFFSGIMAAILLIVGMGLMGVVLAMAPLAAPFVLIPHLRKVFWHWLDSIVYVSILKIVIGISAMLITKAVSMMASEVVVTTTETDFWGSPTVSLSLDYPAMIGLLLAMAASLTLLRQSFPIAAMISGAGGGIGPGTGVGGTIRTVKQLAK
ncbi:MAG: type IV secretion system protein [Gammaproteobacteria bacterium]|nr:type IV secretion system protein [Gammaproteobacteria bacterium]MBU1654580.1 type IV secretion system protein [Gammaproteobacteria bacterium]MBU1961972.1 type IV secretion system protein [Gammaproteobacteria bacterium]